MRRVEWRSTFDSLLQMTAGAVLLAVTLDIFLAPSNIAPGGVSGLALLIRRFTGWPVGLTMLVLNIPLLALGYRSLGQFRFLSRALFVVLIYNLGADVLALWLPPQGLTQDLMLNALFGGVLGGIATGLIYRAGGTAAGTGIIGRVVQMRTGIPLSQTYFLTDGTIILFTGLTFGWDRALYAFIMLFIWGLATDYVLEGPSVVRTVFIVTDEADAVAQALLTRLQLGVTAWTGQGMFTEAEHRVLFCTVNRPDVNTLRNLVAEVDPNAFVVIGQGHQARGGKLRRASRPPARQQTAPSAE